jgi:DNA polymerase-3 subunit delta
VRLYANQFDAHLQSPLMPLYLISGDEPLLVEESLAGLRAAALMQGYTEREQYAVEPGFDWGRLAAAGQSMSLFAERRLIELRMPNGRPGDAGGKTLAALAEAPPEDTVTVIITGKLESDVQRSKWVKAVDKAGAWLTLYPIGPEEMPAWLRQRMQTHGLVPGQGVVEQLVWHFEGNLLAAAQEIEKLAMEYEGQIELETIEANLSDSGRFDVFRLVDACLQGDANGVRRILLGLQSENVAPVLVNWALVREIRQLGGIARECAAGGSQSELFKRYRIWPKRQSLVKQGLGRHNSTQWQHLLQLSAAVDRVIKGRSAGAVGAAWQDGWQGLEVLALSLAGVPANTLGLPAD